MMNIVHVVYSLKYGGIETMLVNIANEQVKYADVSVLIINDVIDDSLEKAFDQNVKVVKIARPKGSRNPFYHLKTNLKLLMMQPDVIHVHLSLIGQIVCFPLFKSKLVYTQHALVEEYDIKYLKSFPKKYAISKGVMHSLNNHGYEAELVYNGIKPENFKTREKNNTEIFRIVAVGRLVCDIKGQDILIQALAKIRERGIDSVSIDFIGDGISRGELESIVNEMGLERYVNFLGAKSPDYICNNLCCYDLFVQPSRSEGFGLTLAESMAAGVPVLTSDQEGPLEVINNGEYGYIFKTGDSEDCAKKICDIIQNDNSQLVAKAKKMVSDCFDIRKTASLYLEKYRQILKNNKDNE